MIKKLSITAGISLVLFGIVAAVVAQQAGSSRYNPLGKISETFGNVKNSIKNSFSSKDSTNRSAKLKQVRQHQTTRRNSFHRSRSGGMLGELVPRLAPKRPHTNKTRQSTTFQEAPKYNPTNRRAEFTANRPAKINTSRRNPERFNQLVPQEITNDFRSKSSSAIASDESSNRFETPSANTTERSTNSFDTRKTVESNSVQPGGYRSLRDRLRTARQITSNRTTPEPYVNKNTEPKNITPIITKPKTAPTFVEKQEQPKVKSIAKDNPFVEKADRPNRVESAPLVANKTEDKATTKDDNPGWNSTSNQRSVLKKNDNPTESVAQKKVETTDTIQINPIKKATPTVNNTSNNVLINSDSPVITVKTIGPKSINIGKAAVYRVNISNLGRAAANDVIVNVKIPAWTTLAGISPSVGSTDQNQNAHQWRISQLSSGKTETLTIKLVPQKSKPFSLGIQWGFAPKASDTVVQVLEPKLKLELTGSDEIHYGKTQTFKLVVSNPGTGDAENVELSVETPGPSATTHKRVLGKLAAGESKTMPLKLTATQAGSLLIRANVKGDGGLSDKTSKSILIRRAGLKIAMSGPRKKFAGTPATYQIRVTNPGNATAENIRIVSQLPTGAKYVNSTGGMFYKSNNRVSFKVDALQAGAERILKVRCVLATAGDNQVRVVSEAAMNLADSKSITTNVEALADLKLEVSDPRGPIAVGEETIYEIKVRNRGSRQAEKVNIVAYFSEGIDATKAEGAKFELGDNGAVTFAPIASIGANDEIILKVFAKAKVAGNHKIQVALKCDNPKTALATQETTRFYSDDDSQVIKTSRIPKPLKNTTNRAAELKRSKSTLPIVINNTHQKMAKPAQYRGVPPYMKAPSAKKRPVTQQPRRFHPPTIDLTPINTLPR